MSPEQAKGLPVDHRSDVFSFGCVLYEMLTGRQPFHGDTVADVLAAVLIREPDFEALPPNLNPRIHELLKRCLDKHPKHRWQAIGDLRLELESVASTATVPRAHLHGGSKWRPVHFAAVGSAALVAGMVGFFAANRSSATAGPDVTRFTISLPESQRFTGTARTLIDVSPDGRQVVYVANDRLFLRSLSQLESTPIPMTGNGSGILEPVFSPDGKSIAFFSTSDLTLRRVATTGGPAMALGQISGTPTGMSWGPEGILFGTGATILRVNPNGGAPETLITLSPRIFSGWKMAGLYASRHAR